MEYCPTCRSTQDTTTSVVALLNEESEQVIISCVHCRHFIRGYKRDKRDKQEDSSGNKD